jgi:hypothetical protein
MAVTNPGFEVVGGTEAELPQTPQASAAHIAMLRIALTALSQRAAVAVMDAFTLITCAGAWWLWYLTPEPNYLQIVHNSIFALFVLAANWIVRGRK